MEILSEKKLKKLNSSSMSISSCESKEETYFKSSIDCPSLTSNLMYEHDCQYYEETKRNHGEDFKSKPHSKHFVSLFLNQVSVLIMDEDYNSTEIVKNVITEIYPTGEIFLQNIIDALNRKGFYLKNKMIFVYDNSSSSFLFAGKEGELRETYIRSTDSIVQIKVRSLYEERRNPEKPKSIKVIIGKVAEWRRWYNGKQGVRGEFENKDLDKAAFDVGIPKKTLDDYMFQIRKARAGGFDFDRFSDEPIGFLREFNKRRNPIFLECRKN